jgi:hypothetical protein
MSDRLVAATEESGPLAEKTFPAIRPKTYGAMSAPMNTTGPSREQATPVNGSRDDRFVPEGLSESSPALQCWVNAKKGRSVPPGTIERMAIQFSILSGKIRSPLAGRMHLKKCWPSTEVLGYFRSVPPEQDGDPTLPLRDSRAIPRALCIQFRSDRQPTAAPLFLDTYECYYATI